MLFYSEALLIEIYEAIGTIVTLLEIIFVDLSPFDILNSEKWRDRAFKKMWTVAGPAIARAAAEDIKAVVGQAYGTVVDVGYSSIFYIRSSAYL